MKRPSHQEPEVEYVEATPIEREDGLQAPQQPQFRTYTTSSTGCVPCCGPVGCLVVLVVGFFLAQSDFFRHMILAGFILLGISTLAGFLAQRR